MFSDCFLWWDEIVFILCFKMSVIHSISCHTVKPGCHSQLQTVPNVLASVRIFTWQDRENMAFSAPVCLSCIARVAQAYSVVKLRVFWNSVHPRPWRVSWMIRVMMHKASHFWLAKASTASTCVNRVWGDWGRSVAARGICDSLMRGFISITLVCMECGFGFVFQLLQFDEKPPLHSGWSVHSQSACGKGKNPWMCWNLYPGYLEHGYPLPKCTYF